MRGTLHTEQTAVTNAPSMKLAQTGRENNVTWTMDKMDVVAHIMVSIKDILKDPMLKAWSPAGCVIEK